MENILAPGRRRRFINGLVLAVGTLGVAVTLIWTAAGPAWFLAVFLLAFATMLMFLQVRERT